MASFKRNTPISNDGISPEISYTIPIYASVPTVNQITQNSSPPTLIPIQMKLTQSNYNFWRLQVLSMLRAHDLQGFIYGDCLNVLTTSNLELLA